VAMAQGVNPRDFGGVDLVDRLLRRDPGTGRYSDTSQFGDFSNVITQSLAIVALLRHGEQIGASPVGILLGNQCSDGGFALNFGQPCSSEVDATAFAVQALLAASGHRNEVAGALDYLESAQRPGGGFGGGGPTSGTNANSTGLAAQALRLGGRDGAADQAVQYLLGQQVGCAGPAEQRGAVAYDANGFDATTAPRATTQAIFGLTGMNLSTVSSQGDAAQAAALDCPVPTTTTAPPSGPTSVTTTPAGPTYGSTPVTTSAAASSVAATTSTVQPVAAAPRSGGGAGNLPATGVQPAPLVAIGVLFVLVGVGLALLGRRTAAAGVLRRRPDGH
jgi:hypothetical protein